MSALDGEISDYKVASSCGVSLRGMFGGKMGSASTEAFDADAVRQLIDGVKESAILLETDEQGETSIRLGLGDIRLQARSEGKFVERYCNLAEDGVGAADVD